MSEQDPPPPDHQAVSTPGKIKVTTTGMCEGFEVHVEIHCDVKRLQESLRFLKSKGVLPPLVWEEDADGNKICPVHKVPLQLHEKQGDTWRSHKTYLADGREAWCRGRPGPDSLGYHGVVAMPEADPPEPAPPPRQGRERADYSRVPASRGSSRWGVA